MRRWPTIFAIVCSIVMLLVLFHRQLFLGELLSSPDSSLAGMSATKADYPGGIAGGWNDGGQTGPLSMIPQHLLALVLPADKLAVGWYIADAILMFLATLLLLKAKRISTPVAMIGSLAMAFSTHTFTLVSAGHLSKTNMMPFAILAFALLDVSFSRRAIWCFALAGLAVGLGMSEHYDVMYMFCLLGAAYGMFRLVQDVGRGRSAGGRLLKLAAGGLVALLIAGAMFLPQGVFIARVLVPSREAVVTGDGTVELPEKKWEFATNWSLPPEEILEFVFPALFGGETGSEKNPYWGRIGQTAGWRQHHQGLMGLRQHGVYLGVFQIMFGLYAVGWALRNRRKPFGAVKGNGNNAETAEMAARHRSETFFWAVAWVLCVLFAMGRHGPAYWLFYRFMPYAQSIRCPIKFMHLVELCTVVLFAVGLERFVHESPGDEGRPNEKTGPSVRRRWSPFCIGAISASAVALVALVVVSAEPESLRSYWMSLGLGDLAGRLKANMLVSLFRGALLFALVALVFLAAGKWRASRSARGRLLLLICAVIAVDLLLVDRPYVKDDPGKTFLYTTNVLVEKLRADDAMPRVVCPVGDAMSQQVQTMMLPYFRIATVNVSGGSSISPVIKKYTENLAGNVFRFWQLYSGGYIFGPSQALRSLTPAQGFEPVVGITAVMGGDNVPVLMEAPLDRAPYVLLRNRTALPRAMICYSWQELNVDGVWRRLGDKSWIPSRSVLIEGQGATSDSEAPPVAAMIKRYAPTRVEIEANATQPGVLLLNDRYDPDWKVSVNGDAATLLRCNGVMKGVMVSPGRSRVVFRYERPFRLETAIKAGCGTIVLLWALLAGVFLRFRKADRTTKGK